MSVPTDSVPLEDRDMDDPENAGTKATGGVEDFEETERAKDAAPRFGVDGTSEVAAAPPGNPARAARSVLLCGVVVVAAFSVLVGWLGVRAYKSQQAQTQRSQFLQVARQGALNLTTIDWQHVDTDVQNILDAATGEFYEDFTERSQPFIDVVKKFQSTSVGSVTGAGLESQTADTAQALVAVAVKTTSAAANAADSEQVPRAWRMRISVQKVDDQMKISDVEFVP